MFEMWFEINGRRVRPDQIGNALEGAMLQAVSTQIQTKVGAVRCPVHQQHARVTATGRSADQLTFNIHGCCQTLVEEVRRGLS